MLLPLADHAADALDVCDGLGTRQAEYAMTRHPHPTYLIILGFILGSLGELFPGIPSDGELILCVLTLAAGFFAVLFLSRAELKETAASA